MKEGWQLSLLPPDQLSEVTRRCGVRWENYLGVPAFMRNMATMIDYLAYVFAVGHKDENQLDEIEACTSIQQILWERIGIFFIVLGNEHPKIRNEIKYRSNLDYLRNFWVSMVDVLRGLEADAYSNGPLGLLGLNQTRGELASNKAVLSWEEIANSPLECFDLGMFQEAIRADFFK